MAHTPIEITHLGSAICSYTRCIAGAIFQVTVPATIIRSACRGEGRKTSMPNREMSNRDMALAIISKAQQASPKDRGHTADFLPQPISASMEVTARFCFRSSDTLMPGTGIASVCVSFSSLT